MWIVDKIKLRFSACTFYFFYFLDVQKIRAKVIALTWTSGNTGNEVPPTLDYVAITNHTSCQCGCNHAGEVCSRFQYWDTTYCRCKCLSWGCPGNYVKDPQNCCSCPVLTDRVCPYRKQVWSQPDCACVCKNKTRKCRIPNKIRDLNTCKCVCPPVYCRAGSKLDSKTCLCERDNS